MDQIEKLLELYRLTATPAERRVLLETVRITSSEEFLRLEETILRERVRAMTMEQLIQAIAAHRSLALQQAEELLRDTVFQHLFDRTKLAALLLPTVESSSNVAPTQSKPNESDSRAVAVVILKDGNAPPSTAGKIPEKQSNTHPTNNPLPRLPPRGIGE